MRRLVAGALLAAAPWLARGEAPAPEASAAGTGPYFSVRLGRIAGEASGVPGDGPDVELTGGLRVLPHLGLEAGLGHYALNTSRYYSYFSSMSGSTAFKDEHGVTSFSAGVRIAGRSRPRWLSVEFAVLGGVGVYRSRTDRTVAFTPFPWEPGPGTTTHASTTSYSRGLYIGASLLLVSPWGLSLGAEMRYAAVETLQDTGANGTFAGPGGLRFGAVVAWGP